MKAGLAAVLILMVGAAAYFLLTAPRAPQDVETAPPVSTPQVTTPYTERTSEEKAASLELNYTAVVRISAAGASMALSGWWVSGIGPAGNYTFGVLTYGVSAVEISHWGATERDVMYVLQCVGGQCTAREYRGGYHPYRLYGKNHTVSYAGSCRLLGLEGVYVVERGVLDSESLAALVPGMQGGQGEYESTSCVYGSIPLESRSRVRLDVEIYGQRLVVVVEMEYRATALGEYSEGRYRQVLQFVKSRLGVNTSSS